MEHYQNSHNNNNEKSISEISTLCGFFNNLYNLGSKTCKLLAFDIAKCGERGERFGVKGFDQSH